MREGGDRFMWLMVFFDLPVKTAAERKTATQFRKFLLKDGYAMLQWSVYARVCNGQDRVDKHTLRLRNALPPRGSIRCLCVTDKQYGRMQILLGNRANAEKNGPEQLVLL